MLYTAYGVLFQNKVIIFQYIEYILKNYITMEELSTQDYLNLYSILDKLVRLNKITKMDKENMLHAAGLTKLPNGQYKDKFSGIILF